MRVSACGELAAAGVTLSEASCFFHSSACYLVIFFSFFLNCVLIVVVFSPCPLVSINLFQGSFVFMSSALEADVKIRPRHLTKFTVENRAVRELKFTWREQLPPSSRRNNVDRRRRRINASKQLHDQEIQWPSLRELRDRRFGPPRYVAAAARGEGMRLFADCWVAEVLPPTGHPVLCHR